MVNSVSSVNYYDGNCCVFGMWHSTCVFVFVCVCARSSGTSRLRCIFRARLHNAIIIINSWSLTSRNLFCFFFFFSLLSYSMPVHFSLLCLLLLCANAHECTIFRCVLCILIASAHRYNIDDYSVAVTWIFFCMPHRVCRWLNVNTAERNADNVPTAKYFTLY